MRYMTYVCSWFFRKKELVLLLEYFTFSWILEKTAILSEDTNSGCWSLCVGSRNVHVWYITTVTKTTSYSTFTELSCLNKPVWCYWMVKIWTFKFLKTKTYFLNFYYWFVFELNYHFSILVSNIYREDLLRWLVKAG